MRRRTLLLAALVAATALFVPCPASMDRSSRWRPRSPAPSHRRPIRSPAARASRVKRRAGALPRPAWREPGVGSSLLADRLQDLEPPQGPQVLRRHNDARPSQVSLQPLAGLGGGFVRACLAQSRFSVLPEFSQAAPLPSSIPGSPHPNRRSSPSSAISPLAAPAFPPSPPPPPSPATPSNTPLAPDAPRSPHTPPASLRRPRRKPIDIAVVHAERRRDEHGVVDGLGRRAPSCRAFRRKGRPPR